MLWFQGAIPAAIASAKRSGAVFVVFVAGEGTGARDMAGSLPPAYLRPQGPPAFPSAERPGLPVLPCALGTAGLASAARVSRPPGRGMVSASRPSA